MSRSVLEQLAKGEGLSGEQEKKAFAELGPRELPQLGLHLLNQRRRLLAQVRRSQKECHSAEAALARLVAPPWVPGTVLRVTDDGMFDVVAAGRRHVVPAAPDLAGESLAPCDPVLLNRELSAVVRRDAASPQAGAVAIVLEVAGGCAILLCAGEEELAALCPPRLAGTLATGDRVLYARDYPMVLERLPERKKASFVLEPAPETSFQDIGGLDDVIAEIRRELDLHLMHPELVTRYGLELMRGLLLAGRPGVGKTMIARAIANHLARSGRGARFLAVAPGGLRSMWYGQAEARIRELFALARSSPGICVLFFDEIDTLGRRGEGIGQDIDGRVLGAILHELSGIASEGEVLVIGATNRIDLCDPALLRAGRFGDRVFTIPRPSREATRQILARYLNAELPYGEGADADSLIHAAVAYLHAPEGGAGCLARTTLSDAAEGEVRAPDVLSGSLLASAVARAKHTAAQRALEGGDGLLADDVLAALDDALRAEARKLESPAAARALLDVPRAGDIVRVRLPRERRLRRHRYLRSA